MFIIKLLSQFDNKHQISCILLVSLSIFTLCKNYFLYTFWLTQIIIALCTGNDTENRYMHCGQNG